MRRLKWLGFIKSLTVVNKMTVTLEVEMKCDGCETVIPRPLLNTRKRFAMVSCSCCGIVIVIWKNAKATKRTKFKTRTLEVGE